MSRVATYLRVGFALQFALIMTVLPVITSAAPAPVLQEADEFSVIITEVQTAGTAASKEFIELYNMTDEPIVFADASAAIRQTWRLQFFSSTSTAKGSPNWSQPNSSITLTGTIPANGYYIISSSQYIPEPLERTDQQYSDRMANTGGGLQLIQNVGATSYVHDRVMWSNQQELPDDVWPAPAKQGSLQRIYDPTEGYTEMAAGGSVLRDFVAEEDMSPGSEWLGTLEPVVVEEVITPAPDGRVDFAPDTYIPTVPEQNVGLLPLAITELLPNPGPPLKDEADEFIELYNPNDQEFQLEGYTLETGITTRRGFVFDAGVVVPPLTYLALYASETRLQLSNSTSQARLIGPDGTLISESSTYEAAKDNISWALLGQDWQWTASPTPGTMNTITALGDKKQAGTAAELAAKKQAAKAASAKVKGKSTVKKASAKVKKAKAAKVKAAKKKKTTKPEVAAVSSFKDEEPKTMIHTEVLVAVAGLAVLYGAYEYRHDVANRIRQLRHNRTVRVRTRQ